MSLLDRIFRSASSIRNQQRLVIMLACANVLVITLVCFLAYSYFSLNQESRERMGALGDIIGADVGAALAFGDDQAVGTSLAALRADLAVKQVFVLDVQGKISAYYHNETDQENLDRQQRLSVLRSHFRSHFLDLSPEVSRSITRDGVLLGSVLVEQDERVMIRKLLFTAGIGAGILLLALGISFLLARRFQKIITAPVTAMAAAMREVSRVKDYSKRVVPVGPDELVQLALNFNAMLGEIEQRDAALQENEARWKFAIEGSGDGVWDWYIQSGAASYSSLWKQMLGYSEEDIAPLYRETLDRVHPEDRPAAAEAMRVYLAGGSEIYLTEYRFRCKDDSYRWILSRGMVVSCSEAGQPLRMIGTHTDITERKEQEKELLKIEKLESLGVLAGGIAHDFNNILTAVVGNISLAQMFVAPGHRSFKPLTEAERASVRAGELAQQLLTFARGGEPVRKLASLRHIVNESISLALHGSNIKAVVEIPDSIHAIEADAGQLSQVFNNLIINALQAMPEGGTLAVAARNEALDGKNPCSLPAGSYIRLTFSDQGCGISEDDLTRIFDPYFSTKPKGNGLGLASVYSIINKHSGHIGVTSTLGEGTSFSIVLPSTGGEYQPQQADAQSQTAGDQARGHILVMDDEELILSLAIGMLEYLGYQVTTCESGAEAIALYQTSLETGSAYASVIMDLTIPGGMGGKTAAEQILALDPGAALVVSSGYSNDPIMSDFKSYGFSGSVTKPYTISELAEVLASVAGQRAAS
jgi:PAS domain S-box-containing protein